MYPAHPHLKGDTIQTPIAGVIQLLWLATYKTNLPTSLHLTSLKISRLRLGNMLKN